MRRVKIMIREANYIPKANINPVKYLFILSKNCGPFAFMTVTETGLKKSIMDATGSVRIFLYETGIHDYNTQLQGPENKVIIKTHFVTKDSLVNTKASLYRPFTKHGDPRIWFSGLKEYASPSDLLLLFAFKKELFIVNLSNEELSSSLMGKGFVYEQIQQSKADALSVKEELLQLLKDIHKKGWIKATANGPTAVGDTLEHELGIARNNSQLPDYKGIELKASRTNKGKPKERITLFAKVPDEGLTYRQILESYGKWQIPDGSTEARFQLYDTFKASRVNAYNLYLYPNETNEKLELMYSSSKNIEDTNNIYVSAWKLETLVNTLKSKHKETFFVKAKTKKDDNGIEYFLYESVTHTSNPNTSILFTLFQKDIITLDLLANKDDNNKVRDHGALFKIMPQDLPLLFGEEEKINLE